MKEWNLTELDLQLCSARRGKILGRRVIHGKIPRVEAASQSHLTDY